MVDQIAFDVAGAEFNLSIKQKISTAIELMVDSYKTALSENNSDLLKLPILLDFKENLECES